MKTASRTKPSVRIVPIAILAIILMYSLCLAQNATPPSSNPPQATAVETPPGSSMAAEPAADGNAAPQATSQTNPPPSGLAGLTGRVRSFARIGPERESWVTFDVGGKYVKAVLGGFQQGGSLGFGIQFTTADLFHVVEFRATALTSPLLYRRFEGEAYIPRVFSKNTHADLWFDYLRRTKDDFFGIGPRIPKTEHTNFDWERRSYNAELVHDVTPHVQVGGYFSLANSSTYRGKRTSQIPIDFLFSGNPNTVPPTDWAPGLLTNTKIIRYGTSAQYDLRNDAGGLTKGAYFYGRIGNAQALKDKTAFADYGWLEGEFDVRGYIPLGSNKTSLALRGYANLKRPRGNSQIPFYDLSFLGGRLYDRGFFNYRFRGNNAVIFSAELRQTVWTQKEDRGLDIFAFGDIGQVWGDNRSQTDPAILANRDFDSRNWRASVGGGFQYRYSKALGARIDFGHSNERNLIYFSLSRGF